MYACYVRDKHSEHEEQDKIDPQSGLFHVRDALKLTRESKFRFGIRLPLLAAAANAAVEGHKPDARAWRRAAHDRAPFSPHSPARARAAIVVEQLSGFLLKKGEGAAVRRWKKRWFALEVASDRIYYYESWNWRGVVKSRPSLSLTHAFIHSIHSIHSIHFIHSIHSHSSQPKLRKTPSTTST